MKTNIAVITYDFHPPLGGAGVHCFELYKQLIKNRNIRVFVFSPFSELSETKNSKIIQLPFKKLFRRAMGFVFFSVYLNFNIIRWIKRYDLQLVHLHGGPNGVFLPRSLPIPVVFTCYHTYAQQFRFLRKPYHYFLKLVEQINYQKSTRVMCISHATEKSLIRDYHINQHRLEVIPCGVDFSKFRNLNIKKRKQSLLFVGRLDSRKGILFLIRTVFEVKKEMPVHLFIVGTGTLKPAVRRLIADLNIGANVTFLDGLSEQDLIYLYNEVSAVVIPSIFEGFSLVGLEAVACGTPVICTDTCGLVDVYKGHDENIRIVPYGDIGEFKREICEILKKENKNRIVKLPADFYRIFSWKTICNLTLRNYALALDKNRRKGKLHA